MTTALAIPDPRSETVPSGWWDLHARPAIIACTSFVELDEIEARLLAFMAYIEALNGDALEFAKALRCVEARRGELLGARRQGRRSDLACVEPGAELLPRVEEVAEGGVLPDESAATLSRWRTIAEHWDALEPVVRAATDPRQVSQSRLLRIAGGDEVADPVEEGRRRASRLKALEGRVEVLEGAIRAHREALRAEEIEPSSIDEALWKVLDD